jgi:hypothetical protein
LPPAFAARLRAVPLPLLAEDALDVPDLRALDVERRLDELLALELALARLRPPDPLLAVDFRAPPEELDALRAPDALDLRALDPPEPRAPDELDDDLRALAPRALDPDDLRVPDDLFRDDPPPLPEPDSAIAPPLKLARRIPARRGRDYLMPSVEVTYA